MRTSTARVVAVTALALAACRDQGPVQIIAYSPCGRTVSFLAYKSAGGLWVPATAEANNVFHVAAPEKVSIVYVTGPTAPSATYAYNLTLAEFSELASAPCNIGAPRAFSGTVSSVPNAQNIRVSIGNGVAGSTQFAPFFTSLTSTLTGLVDVVASAETVIVNKTRATRTIVRRGLDLPTGGAISVMPFGLGGEAQLSSTATLNLTGILPGEGGGLYRTFVTGGGTSHQIQRDVDVSNGSWPLTVLPAALNAAGDVYEQYLTSSASNISRGDIRYDLGASDQSIALGSTLNSPTFSAIGTAPPLILRTSLVSQAEYGSFATVHLSQFPRTITIVTSAGFLGGTPSTWNLDMPDFNSIPGSPSAPGAYVAGTMKYDVTAWQGSVVQHLSGVKTAGTILRYANRSNNRSMP